MQKYNFLLAGALAVILFFSCNIQQENKPIKIAVSKLSDSYKQWLLEQDSSLEISSLYGKPLAAVDIGLQDFDAVLITGGADVYPGYYGKEKDTARCGSFDRYRDSLEMKMIDYALTHKMPLFGVCRGLQIINVALGGTLVIDIPTDFATGVVHRQKDYENCFHEVLLTDGSRLQQMSCARRGKVNSNHHQAVDRLAAALSVSACTKDSLPEAIEWKDRDKKHFLMGVQWHPERLEKDNPLSGRLSKAFIDAAKEYDRSSKND